MFFMKKVDLSKLHFYHQCSQFGLGIFFFSFFWMQRSQIFAGDGALISRITEDGKWLVKNEMLSQFLIQAVYQCLQPWHITPMEIMNFLSCSSGAGSLYILCRFSHVFGITSRAWPVLVFLSSGFFIFACGHTEYYPIVLPAMLFYGYAGVLFLQHKLPLRWVCFYFVIAASLHMAMLIAMPSLLILPWIAGKTQSSKESKPLKNTLEEFWPLLLLIPLEMARDFPGLIGYKAASLSSTWHGLPLFASDNHGYHYAFFEWDHWLDWFYGLALRSWIFWPMVLVVRFNKSFPGMDAPLCVCSYGLTLLPLTFWTAIWHP